MQHEDEREREAAEMLYAGLTQAFAWAPGDGATWLVCRALLPSAELHLRTLGWRPPQLPEGSAAPPQRPS